MKALRSETVQGYACWGVAAVLGGVVAMIVVLSVIEWVS